MKKFLLMLPMLAALCLGFSACSDDDDETGSASELVGTWESVSSYGWEKEDGEIVDEWDEDDNGLRVVVNSDGTCESYEWYNNTWSAETQGTWEYKGGKIYTYGYDGDLEDVATVKSLTSSQLVLEFHEKETYEGTVYEYYECGTYRRVN